MKKRIIIYICVLSLLCASLSSCSDSKMDYPEIYTPEYCYENYVQADPHLNYLYSAKNSIGSFREDSSPSTHNFFGIIDVPLEEYLSDIIFTFMSGTEEQIFKNKNVTEEAILDYNIEKVELFWRLSLSFDELKERNKITSAGKYTYYEHIETLDDGASFQEYIAECIDKGDYLQFIHGGIIDPNEPSMENIKDTVITSYGTQETIVVKIRVYFSDYENLVWDTGVVYFDDGDFYMGGAVFSTEFQSYSQIFIPLPQDIEDIIRSDILPKLDTKQT